MLIWLFYRTPVWGAELSSGGGLDKITLRAAVAAVCSFAVAVLLGPRLIGWLRSRYREPIISDSTQVETLHRHKQWTPTMGGLFIIAGIVGATGLLGRLDNPYVASGLILLLAYTGIGAWDDRLKMATGHGLTVRVKLTFQIIIATVVAVLIYHVHAREAGRLDLVLPFTDQTVSLGLWFVPLAVLVIVGSSNAVNLTDGLDGLACGCLIFSITGMSALVYVAGHAQLADYLQVTSISGAGELTVVATAAIGAVLGFLWFNCHPAQVFMGDTGSLPLGGLLGLLAVVSRQELLLVIIAGVFVVEAVSVLVQVGYYRWRRRRIFRCAPLHHHFQLSGWSESKIVVRFWIASALCAILGLACLKGVSVTPPSKDLSARVEQHR